MIKTKVVYDIFNDNKQKAKEELQQRHKEYQVVFSTPEGRRVLDDILYFSAIDRTAYCAKSDTQTNFNLGKQSVGYYIAAAMETLVERQQPQKEDQND